jgi:glycosyltransferase involved in cell wall biosynthesis
MVVRLFVRKQREKWHVSIDNAFKQVIAHFPQNSPFQLDWFSSSYYSNGIIPRLKAVLEVRRNQADINHITGDTHFFTLGLPKKKTVLTVLDCYFMQNKNPIERWFLKLFWLTLPVRNAQIITAISEATKQDIIKYTGCDPDKIVVIPVNIRSNYTYSPKEFNTKCPTILHIGTAWNKNLARHAEALSGIKCHLHIIGNMDENGIEMLKKYKIDYTNSMNLSDEQMQAAYQNADMLLFCSTFEGFGLPILEAQSVGRVVVTSNTSSMPEVAGDSACLADPLSILSIREAVLKVINDAAYRADLLERSRANIKRFDPHTVALQYEAVYKKVAFGNNSNTSLMHNEPRTANTFADAEV